MVWRLGTQKKLLWLGKRMIVGIVLPAIIFCTISFESALANNSQNWTEERTEILQEKGELEKQEQELSAEMLQLQIKANALKQELQKLEQQIQGQTLQMAVITGEIDVLKASLESVRADLGEWLRYSYYTGTYSYLHILFETESFADFIIRLELISRLVEHNHKKIVSITHLKEQLAAQELKLEQAKALSTQAYVEKKKHQELLGEALIKRQAALARAQKISQPLYQKLLALEERWTTVFPNIDVLLHSFTTLPWSSITPDKIGFNWLQGQIIVDVSEETITKHFHNADPKWLPLKVRIGEGSLSVYYLEEQNSEILLQGALKTKNKVVGFIPQLLAIDGIPVQQDTLQLLTRDYDLTLDITKMQQSYVLEKIHLIPGRLRLILSN